MNEWSVITDNNFFLGRNILSVVTTSGWQACHNNDSYRDVCRYWCDLWLMNIWICFVYIIFISGQHLMIRSTFLIQHYLPGDFWQRQEILWKLNTTSIDTAFPDWAAKLPKYSAWMEHCKLKLAIQSLPSASSCWACSRSRVPAPESLQNNQ